MDLYYDDVYFQEYIDNHKERTKHLYEHIARRMHDDVYFQEYIDNHKERTKHLYEHIARRMQENRERILNGRGSADIEKINNQVGLLPLKLGIAYNTEVKLGIAYNTEDKYELVIRKDYSQLIKGQQI
ncbi:hypothetical protein QE152_g39444 [Popillia japonica]|uniref:Uncharacterized protein n=1 Tax=Popillia japonica TaxID=7064 RepID=A0AAW1HU19_POPJA